MSRIIARTDHETQYPWPPSVFLQGGTSGVVFRKDWSTYQTAFVEAAPAGTFLRGEGATVAEAEADCWEQYLRYVHCDNDRTKPPYGQPWHGPYERRQYTNGSGFCTRCGIWMNRVLPVLPDDPNREPGILEQLFTALANEDEETT